MGKIAELIGKLLAGGTLESVKGILDEVITNKEERQTLLNELKKEENRSVEALKSLELVALNAELDYQKTLLTTEVELRKEATKLVVEPNNSQYSSWLAKNITAIIAITFCAATIFLWTLTLIGHLKASEPTVLLVNTGSTNVSLIIVGYYFGSSVSAKKEEVKK